MQMTDVVENQLSHQKKYQFCCQSTVNNIPFFCCHFSNLMLQQKKPKFQFTSTSSRIQWEMKNKIPKKRYQQLNAFSALF